MAAFVLQKLSDRGSKDPIVARTALQTFELAQSFVDEEVRQELGTIAMDVERRLAECATIYEELLREVNVALEEVQKAGLETQAQGRTVTIPAVMRLDDRTERFLYSAKLCLREIARLFKPFFGQHFDENYKKFTEWAQETLGKDDPVTELLVADRPWIAHVIDMRNAVEHPTHKAGRLEIRNFFLEQDSNPPHLHVPEWRQGEKPMTPIVPDMGVIVHNLLTFFEELLVLSLLKVNKMPFVTIVEIPEKERRPEAPIRFRIAFNGPLPEA